MKLIGITKSEYFNKIENKWLIIWYRLLSVHESASIYFYVNPMILWSEINRTKNVDGHEYEFVLE